MSLGGSVAFASSGMLREDFIDDVVRWMEAKLLKAE